MNEQDLSRFITAQDKNYTEALEEIKSGKKQTHWMWYVFPQLIRAGLSETSTFYAIKDIAEAKAYLQHPVLGKRLIEISKALLDLDDNNANRILGSPDDMKLKSSMTLFSALPDADAIFGEVLNKFFNGVPDQDTIRLLGE